MFEEIVKFFKKIIKADVNEEKSKNKAKERLHLVLTQDRANISADFLAMMKQEIIEVIKKYIDIDENEIDVRLTNKPNEDGTVGSPTLYANIPIISVKNDVKAISKTDQIKIEDIEENEQEILDKNTTEEAENNVEEKSIEEIDEVNEEVEKNILTESHVENDLENEENNDIKEEKNESEENVEQIEAEQEKPTEENKEEGT